MKNKKNVPDIRFKGFADEWNERQLGDKDITTSYSGGTPSVGVKEYYNGSIPFIRSGEINSNHTELFITDNGLANSSAKMVDVGDILYALYGATSGEVGLSQINGAINQAIMAIKPKAGYSSNFIAYWLRKEKNNIIRTYLQGGQGNLSSAIVKNLEIDFPENTHEQQSIGNYFQNIDRLINTSQTKLDKLKSIKKACLEKMFPRNGSTTPELRFKRFTEQWKEIRLGETNTYYTDGNYGTAYPKPSDITDSGNGVPFLRGSNICNGRLSERNANYITHSKHLELSSGHLQEDDIVITVRGSLGALGYVDQGCVNWNINSQLAIIRTDKNELIGSFLIQHLLSDKGQGIIISKISGSALKQLPIGQLKDVRTPITEVDEQITIGNFFTNLDDLIAKTEQQNNKLKNIKKACLDKMFVNTEGAI